MVQKQPKQTNESEQNIELRSDKQNENVNSEEEQQPVQEDPELHKSDSSKRYAIKVEPKPEPVKKLEIIDEPSGEFQLEVIEE